MKETTISACEKNFILQAASESKRLDGRKLDESRKQNVYFGTDWGLCYASLGETKVLTKVSCEVQQPKTTKPNEGLLFINVELSSMAAPHFEPGRGSDLSNHLNRLLEKCIKDSKAVDLESLCLVAEEKVWALRVDVSILNHDGNLVECASVSALAALAHFKRPDVTSDGNDIIIHSITEKDPIPITLHHFPVCVTFALLNNGENVLADPTSIEERVADASLIFGINAYGEICGLHLGGNALVQPNLILTCSRKAMGKAKELVDVVKTALQNDSELRKSKEFYGLVDCSHWDKIKSMSDRRLKVQLRKFNLNSGSKESIEYSMDVEENGAESQIIDLGDNCAELVSLQQNKSDKIIANDAINRSVPVATKPFPKNFKENIDASYTCQENLESSETFEEGCSSKWQIDENVSEIAMNDSDSSKSDNEVHIVPVPPKVVESIELSGDSEEEIVVLESQDIENPSATSKKKENSARFKDIPRQSECNEPRKRKKRRRQPKKN